MEGENDKKENEVALLWIVQNKNKYYTSDECRYIYDIILFYIQNDSIERTMLRKIPFLQTSIHWNLMPEITLKKFPFW